MVDNSGRQKKKGSTNNNNVHVSEKKAHNSPAWLNKLVPVYIAFGTCAGG
jgi:PAB1-binding protein PBP1